MAESKEEPEYIQVIKELRRGLLDTQLCQNLHHLGDAVITPLLTKENDT